MHRSRAQTSVHVTGYDAEEKLQRALQENAHLKQERKELQEKLKRVQTQFRRLVADWRRVHGGDVVGTADDTAVRPTRHALDDLARPATAHAASIAVTSPTLPPLHARSHNTDAGKHAVSATTTPDTAAASSTQRGTAQDETSTAQELSRTRAALQHAEDELARLRRRVDVTPGPTDTEVGRGVVEEQLRQARTAQEQLERQYRQTIDQLVQQRQALEVRVRVLEETAAAEARSRPATDHPAMIIRLQGELRQKEQQWVLASRELEQTQSQVTALKTECGRLVQELQHSHSTQADLRRQLFQREQEKSTLQARCAHVDALEQTVQRKNEELLSTEQELLKTVHALRTCSRESEVAVRQEMQSRLVEVQEMRDDADARRRQSERALMDCRHELAEAERHATSLREDIRLHTQHVARLEREKTELAAQLDLAHRLGAELTDSDVGRSVAVAMLHKRRERELGLVPDTPSAPPPRRSSSTPKDDADKALGLFRDLAWDESWESAEVREAYSRAVLDLRLAETRASQLESQAEQTRTTLQRLSEERDTLLEENLQMRQRLTHVQTVFAKQQLQAYRAAQRVAPDADAEVATTHGGQIDFCIRAVQSENTALLRALGIAGVDAPTTLFLSLDGLRAYDTMLSPTLHSLHDCVDTRFQYRDLDPDEITLGEVQQTNFVLQLHRVCGGDGSEVVATAELPGMALLAAREVAVEETLTLVDGTGKVVGRVVLEMCCSRLLLPLLLHDPAPTPTAAAHATASWLLSASELSAALVAMRAVRYLRVQVFRAHGLAGGEGGQLPQPYVFYTAHSPIGALSCIRDTTVYPANSAFTTDPVFDAAPTDHRVVVDRELLHFIAHGTIVFVVFDARATEVRSNLGMLELPLRPLLDSPQAILRETARLHPQGTLTVGLSWITVGPQYQMGKSGPDRES